MKDTDSIVDGRENDPDKSATEDLRYQGLRILARMIVEAYLRDRCFTDKGSGQLKDDMVRGIE